MASLAAGFGILPGEERPQPVLIIPVRLLNTGGGAPIALMAGRAAEFVWIVDLEEIRIRMADECLSVLIRFLRAFGCERSGSDLQRLAHPHVARFAAIYDVRVGNVDLLNLRIPLGGLLAQTVNLRGRKVHHVIRDVL